MSLEQAAKEIRDGFSGDAEVSVEEIEEMLDEYVNDYGVPESEARRSVKNNLSEKLGVSSNGGGSETVEVAEISEPENWVTLEVEVVDLWESSSESIAQTGLVGDESGTIKFTSWSKSDLPELSEGEAYRLDNVVTDEFQGRLSVKLNKSTEVSELDRDIEVGSENVEVEGALVDIQSGSGLIKRCPEEDCTRVLQNGRCSEHGEVDGEFDLRVKAVVDDGNDVHDVIFNREVTEEVTGVDLEEAKEAAKDALDTSVVSDDMEETLIGRYYRIAGTEMGRYLLAEEVEGMDAVIDVDGLLVEARSV
ncbi:MAG: replication factor A [Halobacteria archaeon]